MIRMDDLLLLMTKKRASDLHITAGSPPMLRVDGEMLTTNYDKLSSDLCQQLVYSFLTEAQKEKFERTSELDLSFGIKNIGRFRINVFRQRSSVAAVLRAIPQKIMTFQELDLPPVVNELMKISTGLILVTGPTGTGKSTTLASMIDYLNERRKGHIITVEDPIEYIHQHKSCLVNQREVNSDTQSFAAALKYALRQDPDIIFVGEMRDLETISAAITVAETGHLVLATLHTADSVSSINRMVDVFPPHQQQQVRGQLSFVLQAVIAQQLLLNAAGIGRVLACEVMVATPAIRNLIRDAKSEQVYLSIQTGAKFGMQTMNQSLSELYTKRKITYNEAIDSSLEPEELKKLVTRTV